MTLEKAIEILEQYPVYLKTAEDYERFEAINLGIEALERCKLLSKYHPNIDFQPLPGETKE